MCYRGIEPEMAGLHADHRDAVRLMVPNLEPIVDDVYRALTENLNPHLPALTALVAMIEAVRAEDFGVLGENRLVRLPLSVIGTDRVRYRTPVVSWLHESILSMRMSDITVEALRRELRPHGLCILFMCSCGVVVGECDDARAYYASDHHRRMDRLRSAIDVDGNPVREIASFDEIHVPTMDLHVSGAECRLFNRIEEMTRYAAQAGNGAYGWLGDEIAAFVAAAQGDLVEA